jgi:hypothetical protein
VPQSGDDDADPTWVRSQSPSVTQFAANLAHRVGSLISPPPGSRALPSDAELEADAQRERDRSRREAERILTREAEERRAMEERVLAMMNSGSPQPVPPPRGRSQTLPNPPSPASSAKEGGTGWWQAAKSRLTPTKDKESLTPAQQVIEEARSRSNERDVKTPKGKDKDWPASASSKYADPTYLSLKIPPSGATSRASTSPTSPTPDKTPVRLSPAPASQPINLSPISLQRGTSPGGTPAREQPPMYASFSPSGTLDVSGTLLTIARRFEKLERWTVSHVRALEERMGDVERWLVDKENERTKEKEHEKVNEQDTANPSETDLGTIKDDLTELQGRITELGREMARFATSPAALSTNTAVHDSPELRSAPPTESMIVSSHESSFSSTSSTSPPGSGISTPAMNILSTPRRAPSLTARESTSPPLARVGPAKISSRAGTRLPYPTGDYASPGDVISPTHTPASSPPPASRPTSMVLSGLPPMSPPLEFSTPTSPPSRMTSPTPSGLPPPSIPSARLGSVSPTPLSGGRKRYTVALGGPIVAPPEVEAEYERERAKAMMGTAYFSTAAESSDDDDDETVGKKGAARAAAAAKLVGAEDWYGGQPASTTSSPRARAQSTYSASSLQSNQAALSKHRLRAQSTDFRTDTPASGDPPGRFVDPLILRRQTRTKDSKPLVGPGKKVPVGQLVAFFDSERS